MKRESEEAKLASESNIKEVLSIAEDLRTKKAEQTATIQELKRLELEVVTLEQCVSCYNVKGNLKKSNAMCA